LGSHWPDDRYVQPTRCRTLSSEEPYGKM